ncbi:serine protease [Roseomonas sp. M0104]|uniref:Serine protease n=1 Tax=Teichococcus coralli TaxID=2545983 RepID=A0A845BF90_9PROT|nr:serine protease [Pseudoroseomonas coralli]MXP65508.1 serine protease [Pseudoroseomonas coralli]
MRLPARPLCRLFLLLLMPLMAGCAPAAPQRAGLAGLRAGLAPDCISAGAAVYIGQRRFLTAAHLVDGTQPLLHGCAGGAAPPWVRLGSHDLPAELMRSGQADLQAGLGTFYVGGRDVALLRVAAPPPGLPALHLCPDGPRPGERVRVVTPRREASGQITALMREADPLHGGYAELSLPLEPGESGGAVIDARQSCLMGLVSHREEIAGRVHTRIVPAPVLRAFLGE